MGWQKCMGVHGSLAQDLGVWAVERCKTPLSLSFLPRKNISACKMISIKLVQKVCTGSRQQGSGPESTRLLGRGTLSSGRQQGTCGRQLEPDTAHPSGHQGQKEREKTLVYLGRKEQHCAPSPGWALGLQGGPSKVRAEAARIVWDY